MSAAPVVFKSHADVVRERALMDYHAACDRGFEEIFSHREFANIIDTPDNREKLIDFCTQFTGLDGTVPSVFILSEAKKHNYQLFKSTFQFVDVAKQRADLIDQIIATLNVRGTMTALDIKNERGRLQNGYTLRALRNRLSYIINAQRLTGVYREKGMDALKAERAEMRGDNTPTVVALLPPEYTASELKKLAVRDIRAFKKLYEQFGKQVDDRLAGRS